MTRIKVCKFGGSSVAGEMYSPRIKELINEDQNRRLIVVSAPGRFGKHDKKVTDLLISAYLNPKMFNYYINLVEYRFLEMIKEMGVCFNIEREIRKIKQHFKLFKNRSYLLSRGEYLTAKIFAVYLICYDCWNNAVSYC